MYADDGAFFLMLFVGEDSLGVTFPLKKGHKNDRLALDAYRKNALGSAHGQSRT
jgi:hypothetical protein